MTGHRSRRPTASPDGSRPSVFVDGVGKQYGSPDGVCVFEDLSLTVAKDEFVAVVGPSGCGKTTLLRLVAGLEDPSAGTVAVDGTPVDGPSSDVAMVFQDFRLLPWKSVLENVALGLKVQTGGDRESRTATASEWVERVGLAGVEDKSPAELSGGMRQRVGLARALAVDPSILLMDEPFGSLDAQTRAAMQTELLELRSSDRKTVLFVTHDIDEAIYLADRLLVMSEKPASIVDRIAVDIDRPRWGRRLEIEASDEFQRIKATVQDELGFAPE